MFMVIRVSCGLLFFKNHKYILELYTAFLCQNAYAWGGGGGGGGEDLSSAFWGGGAYPTLGALFFFREVILLRATKHSLWNFLVFS